MHIQIISCIPVSELHVIPFMSIHRVVDRTDKFWCIVSRYTGKYIWIRKDEATAIKAKDAKVRLSDLAKCLKYLEMIRWKQVCGHYSTRRAGGQMVPRFEIEVFYINEFPFYSAFCHIFSGIPVKNDKGIHICYCPRKPFEHKEWPTRKKDPKGVYWKKKRRSCLHERVDGEVRHRPQAEVLKEIEAIPVIEIMLMLKRVMKRIPKHKLQDICALWNLFIKNKVAEWEYIHQKPFE